MERAHSGVTVRSGEGRSLAGLTPGLEPHAVPVISPPSGRAGRASSQSLCMDLLVGGDLPLHLAETVCPARPTKPGGGKTSGRRTPLDSEGVRRHRPRLLWELCHVDGKDKRLLAFEDETGLSYSYERLPF